eukprot:GHVN01090770.1.p1 GENE.GHVN01090770.1~~GHVN01090770.1.p1  ORF type:complete len:494 (-),score=122.70 GHVN01090770.1:108-1385(-)
MSQNTFPRITPESTTHAHYLSRMLPGGPTTPKVATGTGGTGKSKDSGEPHKDRDKSDKPSAPHRGRPPFTLGVCAMKNKVNGGPMKNLMKRLQKSGDFLTVVFDEDMILNDPVSVWPKVECFVCFYSAGFPLEKACKYTEIVKPVCLNDIHKQRLLRSRLDVYKMLCKVGVPTPRHLIVDHEGVRQGSRRFEEFYDYIIYDGFQLNKPFIEKPCDADDHNNWIYYPKNTGGGCKKLFRKVQNRSSDFYPDIWEVRRDGVYLYEEFLPTKGTDVKVVEGEGNIIFEVEGVQGEVGEVSNESVLRRLTPNGTGTLIQLSEGEHPTHLTAPHLNITSAQGGGLTPQSSLSTFIQPSVSVQGEARSTGSGSGSGPVEQEKELIQVEVKTEKSGVCSSGEVRVMEGGAMVANEVSEVQESVEVSQLRKVR